MKQELRDTLWVGLLAFVSVCLVCSNIWENGDIELKWWVAKAWGDLQFPDFAPNHHNLRWAITLPAALWSSAFGGGALSYLLFNHLVFTLSTMGLYAVIRALTTPLVAAIAFLVWMLNPVADSLPSNLMPELWTIFYLVGALLLLQRASASGSRWTYAGAIALMFLCYGAKETNIFFMPGLGIYELLRRRWANVGVIVGVFAAGLTIETIAVNLSLADLHLTFGRAQAILQAGHLHEMTVEWVYQPSDLLTRWLFTAETNLDRLEYYSKLIYLAFFGVSLWKAWQWLRARTLLPPGAPAEGVRGGEAIGAVWAMGLAFAFCTTFFILSLDPFVLGQPLNDRYLWALLPPSMIVLSVWLRNMLDSARDAKAGMLGLAARARAALEPLSAGRAALASLLAIAAFCTLTRWGTEYAAIQIRRDGFDQPYTVFTADQYFRDVRNHLSEGCTLAFPRLRPARALLVHAYEFSSLTPPEPLLRLVHDTGGGLDGLRIDGRVMRMWSIPRSEWPLFDGKLYAEPDSPGYEPYAIRLEGAGACDRVYWLGQVDIAPRDQLIEGHLSGPTRPVESR